MGARPNNDGQPWTREQLILAFELYCRIPFQRTKANDSRVKELAGLLGRTPASIARKLGNFGAFDPQLAARDISGLTLFDIEFCHVRDLLLELYLGLCS